VRQSLDGEWIQDGSGGGDVRGRGCVSGGDDDALMLLTGCVDEPGEGG
jgi:hypothetical protein